MTKHDSEAAQGIRRGGEYKKTKDGLELVQRTEPRVKGDPLDGVDFSSATARSFAESEGLTASDLEGATATGAQGFTKRDIQSLLAGGEDADGEQ